MALERSPTGADAICDTMEASVVALGILVLDDDDDEDEDGFDKEELEAEAAVSGGAPVVAFEGMEMFNMGADGGGSMDDTVWTDASSEFLLWALLWCDDRLR